MQSLPANGREAPSTLPERYIPSLACGLAPKMTRRHAPFVPKRHEYCQLSAILAGRGWGCNTTRENGKITAIIDLDRESFDHIGLPFINEARVEHKIDFHEGDALLLLKPLDELSSTLGSNLLIIAIDSISDSTYFVASRSKTLGRDSNFLN
ncbi:hypothetical protein EJ110_NYTH23676 [Nymphaea thermarum]|nr:hypothetical protein EJ110_NYTH23676 [Nymphaea thermarum]